MGYRLKYTFISIKWDLGRKLFYLTCIAKITITLTIFYIFTYYIHSAHFCIFHKHIKVHDLFIMFLFTWNERIFPPTWILPDNIIKNKKGHIPNFKSPCISRCSSIRNLEGGVTGGWRWARGNFLSETVGSPVSQRIVKISIFLR